MTALTNIAKGMRETSARIARLERDIAIQPTHKGLLINLAALEKRLHTLEAEFAELSQRELLDICEYRLDSGPSDDYPITAVGGALVTFQSMVTTFLDAIKSGPKLKARASADVVAMASMNFAYSGSGSLAVTMTVPNDRMIVVASDLDTAIERAFQVINSRETADIAVLAKQLGVASIRSAYSWAKQHAKYGLSADIRWKRGKDTRNQTVVPADQLERLAALIEETSESTEDRVTLSGILTAVDTTQRTFRFDPIEGEEVHGRISDDMSFVHPFEVPSKVTMRLIKRTKIHYSIDKEEVNWELVGWEQPPLLK